MEMNEDLENLIDDIKHSLNHRWYDVLSDLSELITYVVIRRPPPEIQPKNIKMLVAGYRNSKLSEMLYDSGFTNLTVLGQSKRAFNAVRRRNIRERKSIEWLVMGPTNMQFENESFDVIVGGLDGVLLMDEPSTAIEIHVSEVKRLLRMEGKYICVSMTLAESEMMGAILSRFHFGWKVNTFSVISENGNMFIMIAWKFDDRVVSKISAFQKPEQSDDSQVLAFDTAIRIDNNCREKLSDSFIPLIPLEDIRANLNEFESGRIIRLKLGQPGRSPRFYNCILLDAQQDSGPFHIQLLVFIVPNLPHLEWITTSSKEQWRYVEHYKTARLLMVIQGHEDDLVRNEDIKEDVFPLVNKVVPGNFDYNEIRFVNAADGIKNKETVHQVTTDTSGLIVVEDLIYNQDPGHHHIPYMDARVRCLTVANLERSKAFLKIGATGTTNESEKKKRKRTSGVFKIDHGKLTSARHTGIVFGLTLILEHMQKSSAQVKKKALILGLGAGLLPMYMSKTLKQLSTEVIEADREILKVAKECFEFREAERLKVQIAADGIQFVREIAAGSSKIDILIVDTDSITIDEEEFRHDPDTFTFDSEFDSPRPVLVSPPIEFVEQEFLLTVKNALSEDGCFIINLVRRGAKIKNGIYARLKQVFGNLLRLEVEQYGNDIIIAFNSETPTIDQLSKDHCAAKSFLENLNAEWCEGMEFKIH